MVEPKTATRRAANQLPARLGPASPVVSISETSARQTSLFRAIAFQHPLLDSPTMSDVEAVWAYDRLKPAFRQAFEQISSLYYFEGD